MNIQAAKLDLVERILSINSEEVINKINELLEKEVIVGFTSEGRPLTKKEYDQRLEIAENQFQSGQFLTQDELEKESENW